MGEKAALYTRLEGRGRFGNAVGLLGRAATGNYLVHGRIDQAECVVAQSFGYWEANGGGIMPGLANEYLANFIRQNFAGLPAILQHEVDDAFGMITGQAAYFRIEQHRTPGRYLDTREVMAQAARIMKEQDWQTAAIVAHPYNLPRTDSCLRALGVRTVTVAGIEPVWDSGSAQEWTRSAKLWRHREAIALGIYALRGWLDLDSPT